MMTRWYAINLNTKLTKHQPVFGVDGEVEGRNVTLYSIRLASSDHKVRDMELIDYVSDWTIQMLERKFKEEWDAEEKEKDEAPPSDEEVKAIKAEMEFDRRREEE